MEADEQPSKKKRWLRRASIALAIGVLVAVGLTVYLLQRPPSTWREAQAVLDLTTETSREQIRQNVLKRLGDLMPDHAPDGQGRLIKIDPLVSRDGKHARLDDRALADHVEKSDLPLDTMVQLSLTNQELVAFINEQFVQWTLERGYVIPGGINDPAVLARGDGFVIAFMIDTRHWQQVFTGDLTLEFRPDGMAVGSVKNLRAGSLPVSVISIADMLRYEMPASQREMADQLGEWLSNLEHFEFRPVLELENRRRARVLAMDAKDGGVEIQLRVQDYKAYRHHNRLLGEGRLAVTDTLDANTWDGSAFADVPTTTD